MKSWGKRRKAKEQALAQAENFANPEPQVQQPTQQQSNSFGKSLRRKKTTVQETKPELDLATALPDTSDFRTSLMMPAFSARFSMLREADDPGTKIGKASDDSVLFPKRASRMNLFANNPLTDIAEVDSLRGSTFRPPFANSSRSNSFAGDGYNSDDGGSIMSRSKPGEGNNLFGGRQKLYRIPAKGDGESFGVGGRHMYENDVSMSMFQQLRLKEKMDRAVENRASEDTNERPGSLQHTTDTEDVETINSPSTGFSKNRGTTSSTTSAPSNRRTSTAATSVASESPALPPNNSSTSVNGRISDQGNAVERNATLHKRLYGTNFDQVSPNRRNFREVSEPVATRARAPSNAKIGPSLSQSRSATNLGEKYSRQAQVFATSAYRGTSPPPSAGLPSFTPMDLGLQDGKRSGSPAESRNNMTTPVSEDEDVVTYTQNIQPNDRGKATAMGLFNRPQRQYDEQQFTQRQLQMAEGRNSPAPSRAESRNSEAQDHRRSSEAKKRSSNSRKSPMLKSRASPAPSNDRASPMGDWAPPPTPPLTNRPRIKSSSSSVAAAANVKARAQELIRRQNAELAALEEQRFGYDHPNEQVGKPKPSSTQAAPNGTFFDSFDASDEEAEVESRHQSIRKSQTRKGQETIHPALRDGSLEFDFGDAVVNSSTSNDATPNESNESLTALPDQPYQRNEVLPSVSHDQSTTQPPNTLGSGLGLAGMISHMRDNSTGSSIYPPASPAFAPPSPQFSGGSQAETPRAASIASTTRTWNPPESTHSDPWDLDKFNGHQSEMRRDSNPRDPHAQVAKKAQQMLGFATTLNQKSKAQQILGDDAPNNEVYSQRHEDNRSMHHRETSSSTQKEREDFDFELAERRRKVSEGLKSAVDSDLHSGSSGSATQPRRSPSMSGNPFSALKHMPSKTSPSTRSAEFTNPSKAMKMLGITGPQAANQASSRYAQHNAWQEEEDRMLQDFGRRPKQRSPEDSFEHPRRSPPRDQSAGRYRDQSTHRSGRSTPYEEERERARNRSATPTSGRSSRNRSSSAASGRSKSRQGRFREEPEPAMPGTFPITPMDEIRSPMTGTPRRPSEPPMEARHSGRSGSAMSNRQRAGSRPNTEVREGGLRRGPSLMTATMPSGQGMRSPRPVLSPNESMPSPRETAVDLNRNSPPDSSMMPRQSLSDDMNSPRRAPMPPGGGYGRPPSPQMTDYNSPLSAQPSPRFPESQYQTDRSASGGSGRKKSISKHMISEPTFLSSTSSVPLVTLPNATNEAQAQSTVPMLPPQNPRRRGISNGTPIINGKPRDISAPILQDSIPESPDRMMFPHHEAPPLPPSMTHRPMAADQKKQRNRLRKSSSEGGSMAAIAARQAMQMDHLASPQVPTFPNRSATNLHTGDGGMF